MKYSNDKKQYNLILEDSTDFMSDLNWSGEYPIEEIDDDIYKFTGTLQKLGELLECCGCRQEDIQSGLNEFIQSKSTSIECWVQSGDVYIHEDDGSYDKDDEED